MASCGSLLLRTYPPRYLQCIAWLCLQHCYSASNEGLVVLAGGKGFADVAVTCLTRAAPHSQQTEKWSQGPPVSPNLTWQELQGHPTSAGATPEKARAGLLGSALGAAANAFKAIGNPARNVKSKLQTTQTYKHHC